MRGHSRRNYRFSPDDPPGAPHPKLSGVGDVKDSAPNCITWYPGVLYRHRTEHPLIHRGANSMRNVCRLTMMGLLLCGVLVLAPNSWAQTRPPILEQIAKTYGLDSYGKIEAIRYTWSG